MGLILIALSLFNMALYFSNGKPAKNLEVLGSHDNKLQEVYYWQGLLEANPEYLEGWLELAKVEYELGNLNKAERAISKAREINPNSEEAKGLKKELGL